MRISSHIRTLVKWWSNWKCCHKLDKMVSQVRVICLSLLSHVWLKGAPFIRYFRVFKYRKRGEKSMVITEVAYSIFDLIFCLLYYKFAKTYYNIIRPYHSLESANLEIIRNLFYLFSLSERWRKSKKRKNFQVSHSLFWI